MLTNSFVWMHDTLGIVGGMALGFLYSPLTMTGMHHSLLPVDIQMVAAGGSFLLAIASCNNVAQGGATLCAMLRTKDKKLKSVVATSGVICSPLTGKAILMSEVPDDTFAAEVLGKGMAVIPSEGKVVPCHGEISTLFDTKHAIGITTKDGVELLIHVGVNTVELNGKYYEAHVAQGDQVKPGQVLLTFDIQKIQEAGYSVATPVIIANTDDYINVEGLKNGEIHCMEPLIKLEES